MIGGYLKVFQLCRYGKIFVLHADFTEKFYSSNFLQKYILLIASLIIGRRGHVHVATNKNL